MRARTGIMWIRQMACGAGRACGSVRVTRMMLGVLALGITIAPGWGQEENTGKRAAPKRIVRLLPVGDLPLFHADLIDGVLQERDLPEGTVPPQQMVASAGEDAVTEVRMMLGQYSRVIDAPIAATRLRLREAGADETKVWAEIALPEGEAPLLVLLWRNPDGGNWSSARHLLLNDSATAAPGGAVRVINLTGAVAGVLFGGEKQTVGLKPGLTAIRQTEGGKALPVSVAVQDGKGGWLRLFDNEVEPGRAGRSLVVIYRSDGESPRRQAKVQVLTENLAAVSRREG